MRYPFNRVGRVWRTVRHLRWRQLVFQVVTRLRSLLGGWRQPLQIRNPGPKQLRPDLRGRKFTTPAGYSALRQRDGYLFEFIGIERYFGARIEWDDATAGKLWQYNLHYFEWIWGLSAEEAATVCIDWIDRHPFFRKAVGWEPYPLSLRLQNWIVYWWSEPTGLLLENEEARSKIIGSLGAQADWLSRNIEWHLLGNHLLENAVALWMAGQCMPLPQAAKWGVLGEKLLQRELKEQVLPDGVHFELSPMYHNRVVFLLSWMVQIQPGTFDRLYHKTRQAGLQLRHPDGMLAQMGDSAPGVYPEIEGVAPADGAFALEQAGYYGWRQGENYLLCKAGKIGPDYQPGHGHCDIGSFELSVGGQRIVTDTGVYNYLAGEQRSYARSTAAHNTFGPEGMEQGEIWGSFRLGRRPEVKILNWEQKEKGFRLSLSHNGYYREGNRWTGRDFDFHADGLLRIKDQVPPGTSGVWRGRIHFAPGLDLNEIAAGKWVVRDRSGKVLLTVFSGAFLDCQVVKTPYFPAFNRVVKRTSLTYTPSNGAGEVELTLRFGEISGLDWDKEARSGWSL